MTDFVESVTPDAPHFVYTFYDADGRELYIGCSGSIGRRISSHMSTQPWWPDVAYFDARRYPNQRAALDAERKAIEQYEPPNNRAYTSRSDVGGWNGRRRRMAEMHEAGWFCTDRTCRTCIDEAHAKNVTCSRHHSCGICLRFRPWWSLYTPERRREHPDWEPMWEDFLDHEPTYEESAAWFDANDPDWRDRFRPLTRRRSA